MAVRTSVQTRSRNVVRVDRADGKLIVSASDLVGFLACGHLSVLDREALDGRLRDPRDVGTTWRDPRDVGTI